MTGYLGQLTRELLAAPLRVTDAVLKVGDALWLYVRLVAITNGNGQVCRTLDSLGKDLGVQPEQIEVWLARLVHADLVSVHVPSPYLVIKLRFWSGSDGEQPVPGSENSGDGAAHIVVPVSSSKQQAAAASSSKREDGGAGEGGDALLVEVLRVLGETDATEFRDLLPQFPKPVILKALLRVKTTPANQIRKSKAALFRYLLNKFFNESHAQTHQP